MENYNEMMNAATNEVANETAEAIVASAPKDQTISVKSATGLTAGAFALGVVITGGVLLVIYLIKKSKLKKQKAAQQAKTATDEEGNIPVVDPDEVENPEK